MKLHICKWIFILFFTKSSAFMILKVNGVSEDQLLSNVYNLLRTETNSDGARNNIVVRGQANRRNFDLSKFQNKVLIKRHIPHGYRGKITGYEYDEKFNTLYKPLFRIHKNNEENYDVVFIIDENNIEDILKELSLSGINDNDVQEFTGDKMEDVLSEFLTYKQEKDKPLEKGDIGLLSFGPIGMMKAKQLRGVFNTKKSSKSVLTNSKDQHNFDPNKLYIYNVNDDNIMKQIVGTLKERVKNNDKVTRLRSLFDPDRKFEYLYRSVGKDATRNLIKGNKNRLHWFGPVGNMFGKRTKRQKRTTKITNNRVPLYGGMESKIFANANDYTEKRKELHQTLKQKKMDWQKEIERTAKSREEQDTPQKLYVQEDDEKTTPKPKKWLPEYSFWNYWTYDKTLYQDECKGDSVRLGEVCVALPPH